MINLKRHSTIALGYFFIVALLGLSLRLFVVMPLNFNFKYVLHAHSHTALLGWVYLGLTTLIYKLFLEKAHKPRIYRRIFYFTNFCILGMLFTFPFQGYGLYSIIFSSLFLVSSYCFSWFCFKYIPKEFQSKISWKLIRIALFYLIFSTLGTWAIGPISATMGMKSNLFHNALYFFLHFLSNGWFYLVLLGVFFYLLEKKGCQFDNKQLDRFYSYLNIGVFLTYFLSVLWSKPHAVFYILGAIGALYQVAAFCIFYRLLRPHFGCLKKHFSSFNFSLLKMAGGLLIIKLGLQVLSALPYFAELAFSYRDFIIGYLHLEFLGIVVPLIVVFLQNLGLLKIPKNSMRLYLLAYISTELLIFYWAIAMWLGFALFSSYYYILAGLTLLYPVSVGWLFLANLIPKRMKSENTNRSG